MVFITRSPPLKEFGENHREGTLIQYEINIKIWLRERYNVESGGL
jgi:hypothetical protein